MSDDETIAKRVDYRVVRPDGALIFTWSASTAMPYEPPVLDSDDSFRWLPGDEPTPPPLRVQRHGDGYWTTIETSEG